MADSNLSRPELITMPVLPSPNHELHGHQSGHESAGQGGWRIDTNVCHEIASFH
jgi:hypothetical protein